MSEKIAVHCKTGEEWSCVLKKCGKTAISLERIREVNGKGKEYVLYIANNNSFDNLEYCKSQGYTIISAADYLQDNTTFKVGDRVECIDATGGVCAHKLILSEIYTIATNHGFGHIYLEGYGEKSYTIGRFKLATNQTKTTKEDTMKKAIEDNFEKTKDANLVEAEFPGSKLTEFVNDHLIKVYAKEILAEAKRLKKEREEYK